MPRLKANLRRIQAHLKQGGLIAYPTESCYGLGCDPNNRRAVRRILKLKQRQQSKGLILIAGRYEQVAPFIEPLDLEQQEALKRGGEKAVTYLMPAKESCPRWLRGKHATLAVRITAHPYAARLCNGLNRALVSTSANFRGGKSARTYKECQRLFGNPVWVLRGKTGLRKRPSTIRNWTDGRILRK